MVYYLKPTNKDYGLAINMANAKANYLVWAIPLALFVVVVAAIMYLKPSMFVDKDEKGNVTGVNKLKTLVAGLVAVGAGLAAVHFGLPEAAVAEAPSS